MCGSPRGALAAILAAFAGGVLVGGALGVAAMARREPPEASCPEVRGVEPSGIAPPPGPRPVADAPTASREPGREELLQENAVLRGQLAALGGAPSPWPDPVPPPLREAELAAWLAEIEPELPAERVALDCAEFPCLAVYVHDPDQPASTAVLRPLADAFDERAAGVGRARMHLRGTPDGAFVAVAFGPADQEGLARLEVRAEALLEAEAEAHRDRE